MPPFETVSFRLTPTLLAQLDTAAADRGMTRSDWIRSAILDKLSDERAHSELQALEKRLFARLEDLQQVLTHHVTVEIDSLTQGDPNG